jgi:hypothetical protein
VKPADQSTIKIREIVFDNDDFFYKEKIIKKLDRLIHAWEISETSGSIM